MSVQSSSVVATPPPSPATSSAIIQSPRQVPRLTNGGDDVTLTAADGTVLATASYGGEGGDNQSLTETPTSTAPASPSTAMSQPPGTLFTWCDCRWQFLRR